MRDLTLAAAESCSGGLLAQRLTAVPGSSRYFVGGAVVYSDALKTSYANVPADLIATAGPVSEPVARALAEGIRDQTGASVGISITGIAGPGPVPVRMQESLWASFTSDLPPRTALRSGNLRLQGTATAFGGGLRNTRSR